MRNSLKILLIIMILAPVHYSEAVSVYFDPETVSQNVGVEFTADVLIDTEGEDINALQGEIVIPDGIKVRDIIFGKSVVPFWIKKPAQVSNIIKFSGIIPGGFQGVLIPGGFSSGNLMTLVLESENSSNKEMIFQDLGVFFNDGLGTPVSEINSNQMIYSFTEDGSSTGVDYEDTTPPEEFDITLVEDEDKHFLVFYAQDKESGVQYYEIKIGNKNWERAESPYEVSGFMLRQEIFVKAVDGFGNTTTSRYKKIFVEKNLSDVSLSVLLLIVSVILIVILVRKKW